MSVNCALPENLALYVFLVLCPFLLAWWGGPMLPFARGPFSQMNSPRMFREPLPRTEPLTNRFATYSNLAPSTISW